MAKQGELLKSARIAAGLTQTELAEKIGMARGSIVGWETDLHPITEKRLPKLKEILGDFTRKHEGAGEIDEASPFGAWLRKARAAKDFSVPQLSEKSGVSVPAIRLIESGKSLNPQKATREKLQSALQTNIPKDVVDEAEADQEIQGLGSLTDFDPYDEENWPNVPGVYVFYDVSERPIYIGQGVRIAQRVKSHSDKFWYRAPIVSRAAYVQIPEKKLRQQIEQVLIKFLKSNAVVNKMSVDRQDEDE